MKTFWTVFKKEWLNIFRDRRSLIINAVIFGIGIPAISLLPYLALIGSMFSQLSQSVEVAVSGLEHAPMLVSFTQIESEGQIELVPVKDVEAAIHDQEYSVGLIIPPDFESKLASYQPATIELISRQGRILDTQAGRVSSLLRSYRDELLARRMREKNLPEGFTKPFSFESREVITESRFQRSEAGWLMVFVLTLYGFAVGMSKAVSLTAGEKEQLTMEVLLLSPANRAGIVLGKAVFILTYGLASLFVGFVSTILVSILGLILLTRTLDLTKIANNFNEMNSTTPAATLPTIAQLTVAGLLVMMVLALFCLMIFTLLQMLVGLWARNEGQANNILAAIMLLPGIISLLFFSDTYSPPLWHYAIPLLGQILLLPDLLVNRWEAAPLVVTLISSLLTVCLFSLSAAWLLRQETIISRT